MPSATISDSLLLKAIHPRGIVFELGPFPSGNTQSDASLTKAKDWLEQCVQNHPWCGSDTKYSLSTRVLDVVLVDAGQDVRLYTTRGECERYACLSHYWGDSQSITTPTSNLKLHSQSIRWESLPRTFQDAVTFIRKLNIRYLWIDSLCVIQGDEDDWREECSRMAPADRNAFLTLAATGSTNANSGCFSGILPQFQAHELSAKGPHGESYQIFVRQLLPHLPPLEKLYEGKQCFPLLRRAWVYQERLLSSRVLHFIPNELMWECMKTSDCECGSMPLPDQTRTTGLLKVDHIGSLASFSVPKLTSTWHQMVEEYSALQLTFQRDKLHAFAVAAAQMQYHRKDRYLAGLWEDSLALDLLWTAKYNEHKRPTNWRSPTWSWASVSSPTYYAPTLRLHESDLQSQPKNVQIRTLEAECTPASTKIYYEVVSGRLRISGQVIPVAVIYIKPSSKTVGRTGTKSFVLPNRRSTAADSLEFDLDYPAYEESDGHVPQGGTAYCLRVARMSRWTLKKRRTGEAWCLMLRCVDKGNQVYERIGILSCQKLRVFEGLFKSVKGSTVLTIV